MTDLYKRLWVVNGRDLKGAGDLESLGLEVVVSSKS